MKFKTFLVTYILFIFILFTSLGTVSVYMTNSQMSMLKERGMTEFQTIANSLVRDIAVLHGRSINLSEDVNSLVRGYTKYYERSGIGIELTDISSMPQDNNIHTVSLVSRNNKKYVFVTGGLPEPFQYYNLEYRFDISSNIADMVNIQNILLIISITFSVITALALYFILSAIFKPLDIVSKTSRKIAHGHYDERIYIKGKSEIFAMAGNFNQMADKIERQIRLLEEEATQKQQFVDNFAHEIRTPLTSIFGYAEYMQKAHLNEEEIIESSQYIMDEASHMKKIANSLLELATLRNYVPTKSKISIPQLFEDISQTLKKSLTELNIQFVYRSDVDILECQEDLVKSLLLNLCINALKACTSNSGVICLKAEKQEDSTILSVVDNGCGIPEESISKVVEPFYRADKSRNRETGGAGLGLSICKQIAEVHGAKMSIESSISVGTSIKIIFTSP